MKFKPGDRVCYFRDPTKSAKVTDTSVERGLRRVNLQYEDEPPIENDWYDEDELEFYVGE